jgi:hypothetical protein
MTHHALALNSTRHKLLRTALVWLPFIALLAWSWRIYDLANFLPGYGDVLESLWAIDWYRGMMFDQQALPLFNPAVFYPNGWHSATWANGMLIYFVGALLAQITGNAALAFNLILLTSNVVSYLGAWALLRRHSTPMAAVIGALLFTFWEFHWLRSGGHPQVAWCIALLPWFVLNLEEMTEEIPEANHAWPAIRAGLMWGLMIHATLYGIFWGGIVFALFVMVWGRRWFSQRSKLLRLALVVGVAGLLAAPLVMAYWQGIRADQTVNLGLLGNRHWSASLNTLFLPNSVSPFFWLRDLTHLVYNKRVDETSLANMGLSTWLLAGAGAWALWRTHRNRPAVWFYGSVLVVCTLLSLGPLLVWDGVAVQTSWFRPLNAALWQLGRWARPADFATPSPEPAWADAIPLPAYVFYVLVPFSESARVLSRYTLVGMLGCAALIALCLSRMRWYAQLLVAGLLLIECLPWPFWGVPVPTQTHSAYRWIREQPEDPAQGNAVFEILDNKQIPIGGEIIYALAQHRRPTLNGLGSFPPKHLAELQTLIRSRDDIFASPALPTALAQYGARYVVLHLTALNPNQKAWEDLQRNPLLRTGACYGPEPLTIVWRDTLCVAEIKIETDALQKRNLIFEGGWAAPEDWGIWATGPNSQAQFLSPRQQDQQLHISAFPVCIKDQPQHIVININDAPLSSYTWRTCEVWNADIRIPSHAVRVGLNRITFSSTVAASPHATDPANNDKRELAVGFTVLRVAVP